MAVFTGHNSWGRTRSPKNIVGSQGGEVETVTEVSLVGVTAAAEGLGYFLQNQRYLHVLLEDGNEPAKVPQAITVYGYCHAFLRWFPLPAGPAVAGTPLGAVATILTAPTDEGVAPGHDDFLPSGRFYRTYEVLGIDKVAFVGATAADDRTTIFAATSTF